MKKIIFIFLFIIPNIFANTCLESATRLYKLKSIYSAVKIDNPISFSYEIEFALEETPNIVNYFKVRGYSDNAWCQLSKQQKLEIAIETQRKTSIKNAVIMEKLNDAPDFLASTLIWESSVNLEMINGHISIDLSKIHEDLDWIWENIGAGSVQAHAAFNKNDIKLENIENLVKTEYDVSQASALVKGYESFIKNGNIPGNNLSHYALGPVDDITLKKLRKDIGSPDKLKSKRNFSHETKYVYGIVYRPDLYGKSKVGFEIRNCHKRLNCIKEKMHFLATDLEMGLRSYKNLSSSPTISSSLLDNLPKKVREVYLKAAVIVKKTNESQAFGSNYQNRYLFPHLDWNRHPLINNLTRGDRTKFKINLDNATDQYIEDIISIGRKKSTFFYAKNIQIATAKWAHSINLDLFLNKGMLIHQNAYQKAQTTQKLISIGAPLNVLETLFSAGMSSLQVTSLEKILSSLKNNGKDIPTVLEFASEYHAANTFLSLLDNLKPSVVWQFLTHKNTKTKFLKNFNQYSEKEKKSLSNAFNITGVKTTTTKPDGSWAFKKILNSESQAIKNILFKIADTELELINILTLRNITYFPTNLTINNANLIPALEILSGRKTFSNFKWMINHLENLNLNNKNIDEAIHFYQVLFIESASNVQSIGNRMFVASMNGEEFVVKLKKRRIKPFSFKSARTFGFEKLENLKNARIKEYRSKKIKMSEIELINIIRTKPHSVFVISATNVNHQGLVIGDIAYSVLDDRGVQKLPVENWISTWGSTTLVELSTTNKEKNILLESVEATVNKPVNFATEAKRGSINCTNMVSCHLEGSAILQFPDSYTRSDSKGQINYLSNKLNKDDKIKAVYIRKNRSIPPSIVLKGAAAAAATYLAYRSLTEDEK